MLLLRVIYAASLPDPGELAKLLESGGVAAVPLAPAPAAPPDGAEQASAAPEASAATALTVAQIHQLPESAGHHQLARQVYEDVQVVTLEPGVLAFWPAPAVGYGLEGKR